MGAKSRQRKTERPLAVIPPVNGTSVNHVLYCFIGLAVALLWTALGCGIAALNGGVVQFLKEWYSLQGFFLVALGAWLLLMIRSGSLVRRVSAATLDGSVPPNAAQNRRLRIAIVAGVGSIGTASLTAMGFDSHGLLLGFMCLTCACVSFTAAGVTLHAVEMLVAVHGLQALSVKAFRYSPARTPELRDLVNYFTSLSLLMTIGYAFALAGTMSPYWTGSRLYVDAVRIFWPILYVPTCSAVLVYPHVIIHRLIRREKEQTLLSCQQEIDTLLTKYRSLNKEEVERTNSLAQLFDRINATPDYVLDLGIAVRTLLPLAFNVASLVAKLVTSHP